jgi:hypothetical protein
MITDSRRPKRMAAAASEHSMGRLPGKGDTAAVTPLMMTTRLAPERVSADMAGRTAQSVPLTLILNCSCHVVPGVSPDPAIRMLFGA